MRFLFTESLTSVKTMLFGAQTDQTEIARQIEREALEAKLINFHKAWEDLKAADSGLGAAGLASLWFIKDILSSTPIFLIWIAGGVYLYHQSKRNEKLNHFQTRLKDLYSIYKSHIDPVCHITPDTIKILSAIAPFTHDTEALLPPDFSNFSKILLEKEEKAGSKGLLEQWCDILARSPHHKQFVFVNPKENKAYASRLFQPEPVKDTIEKHLKKTIYGTHLRKLA